MPSVRIIDSAKFYGNSQKCIAVHLMLSFYLHRLLKNPGWRKTPKTHFSPNYQPSYFADEFNDLDWRQNRLTKVIGQQQSTLMFKKYLLIIFLISTSQLAVPLAECRRANKIWTELFRSIISSIIRNCKYMRR